MSFHISQLVWFLVLFGALAAIGGLIRQKSYKSALGVGVAISIVLFAMPVRWSAPAGVVNLEQPVDRFASMPERVTIDKPDFEALREQQLNELKERSEELESNVQN